MASCHLRPAGAGAEARSGRFGFIPLQHETRHQSTSWAVIRVYNDARTVIENLFGIHAHYLCFAPTTFCTNASKRGSPRRGSSVGSTLIMVMVRPS